MYFLFAWRYFKAKKSTNAINIIAWVSISAIIIGTTALILVLSVFNGFEGLVKSLYSSFYTDIRISPASGKIMTITQEQINQLKGLNGIKNFSLSVEEKALVQNGESQSVVYLKGVDDNYRYITGVADNLLSGEYDIGTSDAPKLILGAGVEGALQMYSDQLSAPLKIYLPRKSNTEQINMLEDISNDTISSSGSFRIQQDFDNKYGITNIDFVKRSVKLGIDDYSFVEILVKDPSEADNIKKEIKKLFGDKYIVQNKYEQNRSLYSIMNAERWVIYGVLCLILVVAAFNMIGALTMLVLEKQKDISVLHALGGNRKFIQRIFLSEGMLLALIGCGVGMLLALLIAFLQVKFHLIPLAGGSFLIDYFPVKLRLMDFLLVGATVFVIAFIASWLPSRKAAAQNFSLRSE
ncbi:MAG: ABC transporter permease [Chitinophagaceae bacterium]|nr:ABC transporter permease [Chitinophagaceae bacterium]MBP7107460.1 ABC transporter permease [Chitinophagaceae bacterium]MBP7315751.1 ABC transporter permease [Chitinophagaceae bacterium]HQX95658.1 FtsX-like permease family protein [Chitinophagaceae bacterium]HQZ48977.1 FtsX-like permease family protein [Chitinophagaceae bacterium]